MIIYWFSQIFLPCESKHQFAQQKFSPMVMHTEFGRNLIGDNQHVAQSPNLQVMVQTRNTGNQGQVCLVLLFISL